MRRFVRLHMHDGDNIDVEPHDPEADDRELITEIGRTLREDEFLTARHIGEQWFVTRTSIVRWADIIVVLEEGDPGYVPPADRVPPAEQ